MMQSFYAVIWLVLSSINLVYAAAPWTCLKETINVYGSEFCEAEHAQYKANQASIGLNTVFKELLVLTPENDRERLIASQQAWLSTSQAECETLLNENPSGPATQTELAASCREQQIQKRTKELQSLRNQEHKAYKQQALNHSQICLGRLEKSQDKNNDRMCITKGDLSTFLFCIAAIGIILQLLLCVPYNKKGYFRQGSYMNVMRNIRKENTLLGNVLYFLSFMNIALLLGIFALSFVP